MNVKMAAAEAEQVVREKLEPLFPTNPACLVCPEEPSVGPPREVTVAGNNWMASGFNGCSTVKNTVLAARVEGETFVVADKKACVEVAMMVAMSAAMNGVEPAFYTANDDGEWAEDSDEPLEPAPLLRAELDKLLASL